jgi:HK97 family phage portal protein
VSFWDIFKAGNKPAQLTAIAGQGKGSSVLGQTAYEDPRRTNEALWQLYCSNPWVRRCVDLIANSMSKGYRLISETDENTVVEAEQLEAFLNSPNDVDSFETFVGKIARSVVIHGIAFVEVQKVGLTSDQVQGVITKTLSSLSQIMPDLQLDEEDLVGTAIAQGIPQLMKLRPAWQIEVVADKRGTVTGYKQWTAEGECIDFTLDEIVVILHPASLDQKYGNSPLEPISTTAVVDNHIRQRQKSVFKNAAAIDKIFHLPAGTSKENTERLNEQITQRYRGVNAAGSFLVVSDPVTVEDLAEDDKDGSYLNLKQVHKEEICQCLGVPMSVVGETSGTAMNGAGSTTHNEAFQENTVRPLASHIQRILNERIFSAFESVGITDVMVKIVTESAEDEQALETMWDTAVKNGSMTVNDVRRRRGQDAYEGYGDEPYVFLKDVTAVKNIGAPPPEVAPIADVQKALTTVQRALRELRKAA